MRVLLAALLLTTMALAARPAIADAAGIPLTEPAAEVSRQETVDDNDDTRVEVQLVVLGVALALVVGLGIPLFLLRKKLGLVPPPPEPGAGDPHH
jgi:hypothetical protein